MRKYILLGVKSCFWFLIGVCLGLFFTLSFAFIYFQKVYANKIYPGVFVAGVNLGGKTIDEAKTYFNNRNKEIQDTTFTFTYTDTIATASAKQVHLGYNSALMADQAYVIGRSQYIASDITMIFLGYLNGIFLPPSYTYDPQLVKQALQPISDTVKVEPVDAVFSFTNGRVTTFTPSTDGQELAVAPVLTMIQTRIPYLLLAKHKQNLTIPLSTTVLKPKITTDAVNDYGIKELLGVGTSLFQHSIPGRIYNVNLGASRVNGVLVAPNEEFSFAKAVGDVSSLTGYQQAYIIQNGKTILGDGGGICQVSTTLFRAVLNAGLPVTERHGHAYRVGYYEEDGPPGIDATVYVPSVDFRFRNDTGHYILIQSVIDPSELRLTFYLYGTADGRKVQMTTPVVTNETPAPPPLYTDDPTLPKGVIKQVDFAANGARVSFSRTVTKDNKTLISETYVTNYQPWQAAYLRGTKE